VNLTVFTADCTMKKSETE